MLIRLIRNCLPPATNASQVSNTSTALAKLGVNQDISYNHVILQWVPCFYFQIRKAWLTELWYRTLKRKQGLAEEPPENCSSPASSFDNEAVCFDTDSPANPPLTKKQRRKLIRAERGADLKDRKTEQYQASDILDASELRISSSGWAGNDYRQTINGAAVVKEWHAGTIGRFLVKFKRIPYTRWVTLY